MKKEYRKKKESQTVKLHSDNLAKKLHIDIILDTTKQS